MRDVQKEHKIINVKQYSTGAERLFNHLFCERAESHYVLQFV